MNNVNKQKINIKQMFYKKKCKMTNYNNDYENEGFNQYVFTGDSGSVAITVQYCTNYRQL